MLQGVWVSWGACVMNSSLIWVSQKFKGHRPHVCRGWEAPASFLRQLQSDGMSHLPLCVFSMGQGGCSPYSGTGLFLRVLILSVLGHSCSPPFLMCPQKGGCCGAGDVPLGRAGSVWGHGLSTEHCPPLGAGGVLGKHKWWTLEHG